MVSLELGPSDTFHDVVGRQVGSDIKYFDPLGESRAPKLPKAFRLNPLDRQEVMISMLSRLYILAGTAFEEGRGKSKQFAADIQVRLNLIESLSYEDKAGKLVAEVLAKRDAGEFVSGNLKIENVEISKFFKVVAQLLEENDLPQAAEEFRIFENRFNLRYPYWKGLITKKFRELVKQKAADPKHSVESANGPVAKVKLLGDLLSDVITESGPTLRTLGSRTMMERRHALHHCESSLQKAFQEVFYACAPLISKSPTMNFLVMEVMHAASFLHAACSFKAVDDKRSSKGYYQSYFKFMAYLAASNLLGLNREIHAYSQVLAAEFDKKTS